MSLSSNFPTSKPSLNLDFANVGALDPRITFSRTSSATYTNSLGLIATAAAGVARFDYDPTTLAARGLLVEEQRTNLLTYSEQFNDAAWIKSGSTITANAAAAPNGTVTADLVTYSSNSEIAQIVVATNGTLSFWAKGVLGETLFVGISGTVASNIITLSDSWQRYSLSFSGTSTYIYIGKYAGATVTSVYLWGAQLEAGSFATSYIPTVASTVTRSADVPTVNTLSPFYNATEGTIYAEWSMVGSKVGFGYPAIAQFDDTTATNYIAIRQDGIGDSRRYGIVGTSSTTAQMLAGTAESLSANTVLKSALAYKANDFAFVRGSTLGTSSSGAIPAVTNLKLGRNEAGAYINAHLRRIAYYPRRLTNAELQALSA